MEIGTNCTYDIYNIYIICIHNISLSYTHTYAHTYYVTA